MDKTLLDILEEKRNKLSKRQCSISQYIKENYETCAFMTAEHLSEVTGVSESTVVRFAYELGYDGYPGLRKAMQELLRSKMNICKRDSAAERDDFIQMFSAQISSDVESINAMAADGNKEEFAKAMELLVNAKKIYLCADSSVITLSAHVASMLRVLHTSADIVCLNEEYSRLFLTDPQCVLLYFSIGNLYDRVPVSLRMARDAGAKIITVAGREDMPASRCADVRLVAKSCAAMVTTAYAIVACFEKLGNTTLERSVRQIEQKRLEYDDEEG